MLHLFLWLFVLHALETQGLSESPATLSSLGITPGFLKPVNVDFSSQFNFYVDVSSMTRAVTVSATPVSNKATLRINGELVVGASKVVQVPYGSSEIRIEVSNGVNQETYRIVALRQLPLLEHLHASKGIFFPPFDPSHSEYLLVVPYERDPVTDETSPQTLSLSPSTTNSDVKIFLNNVQISEENSEKLPDPKELLSLELRVEVQSRSKAASRDKVYHITVLQEEQATFDVEYPSQNFSPNIHLPPLGFESQPSSPSCGSIGNTEAFDDVTVLDANMLFGSPNIILDSPATLSSLGVIIPEALVNRQIKLGLFENNDDAMTLGNPVAWTLPHDTQPGKLDLPLDSANHVNLEAGTYWLLCVLSESKDFSMSQMVEMYSSNEDRAMPFVKIDHPFRNAMHEINLEKGLTREIGIQLNTYIKTECDHGVDNPRLVNPLSRPGYCPCSCDPTENQLPQVGPASVDDATATHYQHWSPLDTVMLVVGAGLLLGVIATTLLSTTCKFPTRERWKEIFGQVKQLPKRLKENIQESLPSIPSLPLHLRSEPQYPANLYDSLARFETFGWTPTGYDYPYTHALQDHLYEERVGRPVVVLNSEPSQRPSGSRTPSPSRSSVSSARRNSAASNDEYEVMPTAETLQLHRNISSESLKSRDSNSSGSSWLSQQRTTILRSLQENLDQNLDLKPYQCPWCKLRFAQKGNWTVHKRLHTGDKRFKCERCSKTFARKQTLISHIRIHSNDKPHECSTCDRKFTQRSQLVRHERTHTGAKPFPCKLCEKKFSDKRNLISHLKKKHPKEAPKLLVVLSLTRRSGKKRSIIKIESPDVVMKKEAPQNGLPTAPTTTTSNGKLKRTQHRVPIKRMKKLKQKEGVIKIQEDVIKIQEDVIKIKEESVDCKGGVMEIGHNSKPPVIKITSVICRMDESSGHEDLAAREGPLLTPTIVLPPVPMQASTSGPVPSPTAAPAPIHAPQLMTSDPYLDELDNSSFLFKEEQKTMNSTFDQEMKVPVGGVTKYESVIEGDFVSHRGEGVITRHDIGFKNTVDPCLLSPIKNEGYSHDGREGAQQRPGLQEYANVVDTADFYMTHHTAGPVSLADDMDDFNCLVNLPSGFDFAEDTAFGFNETVVGVNFDFTSDFADQTMADDTLNWDLQFPAKHEQTAFSFLNSVLKASPRTHTTPVYALSLSNRVSDLV